MTAYDPSLEDTLSRTPRVPREVDPTLAVVVARLDDIREDVKALRDEMRATTANVVSKGEWMQRNSAVDSKFDAHGREIGQLRQDHAGDVASIRADLASRRTPWPAVAGAVTGAGSLLIVLIQNIQS